jgi:hypothetical protein
MYHSHNTIYKATIIFLLFYLLTSCNLRRLARARGGIYKYTGNREFVEIRKLSSRVIKKTFFAEHTYMGNDCALRYNYYIRLESEELFKDSTALKRTCLEIYKIIVPGKEPMEKFFKYKLNEFEEGRVGWPKLKVDYTSSFHFDIKNQILIFTDLRCNNRDTF